jgi:hypothetical protein
VEHLLCTFREERIGTHDGAHPLGVMMERRYLCDG